MIDPYQIPRINWIDPPEERPAARHVSMQTGLLGHYARRFATAADLISSLEASHADSYASDPDKLQSSNRHQMCEWMAIAARDATFSVYHFRSTLRSVIDGLEECPTLSSRANVDLLNEAWEQFLRDFPDWREMRNAVGHVADMMFSLQEMEKHRPGEGSFVQDQYEVSPRRLTMSRHGRSVHLEVTEETLANLLVVLGMVTAAFPDG